MDVIEYIQSEKGKPKLKYKGYLYIYQKSLADNRHSLECEFRRKNLCKARIQVTHDDQYHGQTNEHTHAPNIAKIEADTVIANIKHQARTTYKMPQQIITECLTSSNPGLTSYFAPNSSNFAPKFQVTFFANMSSKMVRFWENISGIYDPFQVCIFSQYRIFS